MDYYSDRVELVFKLTGSMRPLKLTEGTSADWSKLLRTLKVDSVKKTLLSGSIPSLRRATWSVRHKQQQVVHNYYYHPCQKIAFVHV